MLETWYEVSEFNWKNLNNFLILIYSFEIYIQSKDYTWIMCYMLLDLKATFVYREVSKFEDMNEMQKEVETDDDGIPKRTGFYFIHSFSKFSACWIIIMIWIKVFC